MRNTRNSIICIVSVLALAGAGALGNEQPISATQAASCVVTITVNPAIMPLEQGTAESLIRSSGVAGRATRDVLGVPNPDIAVQVLEGIEIEWLAEGPQQGAITKLSVQLPEGVKPAAEEFLSAIVRNLRVSLVGGAYNGCEDELVRLVHQAEGRYESAAEELNALLGSGTDMSLGQVDVDDLVMQRRELTRNLQDLDMNLASMDARREAIEEQIARTRHEMDAKQAGDEITRELTNILQTNEELLSNLEKSVQAGRSALSELAKAKEAVMHARIELARRREELAKSAGGGRLSQYSADLSEMSINAAETRVRLRILGERLAATEAQLKQASKFDPKAARIRVARETLDNAERRVSELRRRLVDLEPPIVAVIGAN